ncbi:hypothetical protein Q8A64_08120 [Oxalobacteraceae bacterium R-40]|uniref:Uncharacterized protein n=1 Tax=Keguizhuia sedimenti TaxID=3064264 RepID=A0ABU1BQU4_9BURK|nr:hypothetical protein [Oxalobacteraceae bacterium R-40]
MPTLEYTRKAGKGLTYEIIYDKGEYFIKRNGAMKKAVSDAMATGVAPHEATPDLMLKLAIGDIESLNGMDE